MAQWGRNDQSVTANSSTTKETSNGAPIGTYTLVKGSGGANTNPVSMDANANFGNTSSGSRASVDVAMYGNTTFGAFIPGMAVGVFAVNTSMLQSSAGNLIFGYVTNAGTGYGANATVTLTVTNGGTSGVVNAFANSTGSAGKITALNIQTAGGGYVTPPTVTIAAPASINISANTTGVVANTLLFASANSKWQVGDRLFYGVPTSNTAIPGLTGNTYYYVSFANTTGIELSATAGGANIALTPSSTSTEVHTITGITATGYVDVSESYPQVTHAGWVVRREGTGGRAGRVHYETLVAMGTIGAQTAPAPANPASNSTVDSII